MTVTTLDSRQPAQPSAALAIRPGQTDWDKFQAAALSQIGLKDASNADRAVFLHQCQRTGLDPFSRQIYMIGRNEKQRDGSWGTKWTIQTGIDGWRVIRDRAEKRAGVRGILGRAIFYDREGNEFRVWVRPDPPAACEITYTVRDATGETPYTSVLQFDGYVQTKDGRPVAQWATKGPHMLEKCTEADVYRKAFPQDFAGISLDDAMPPPDEAPAPANGRVTAADIQGRTRPQVRGQIMHGPPDASPAETAPFAPPAEPAGEAPTPPDENEPVPTNGDAATSATGPGNGGASSDPDEPLVTAGQLTAIRRILTAVFAFTRDEEEQARAVCAHITDRALGGMKDMTRSEGRAVVDTLADWRAKAKEQEVPPRDYLDEVMTAGAEAGDGD
jgi:phage recombination protein Bet